MDFSAVKGTLRGVGLGLKNASPTIMVVGGIGCMVASTVFAVKESKKGQDIVDQWADRMQKADTMIAALEDPNDKVHVPTEDWNVATVQQARINEHINTAKALAKNYAPAIFAGLLGIGLILGGHGIQIRRIGALGAALETVSNQFADYRKNVQDNFGEDADVACLANGKIGDVTVDTKDGKPETIKNAVIAQPKKSALSLLFDESNPNWTRDAQANKFFLETVQAWAQNMVNYSGQVSLAEVYKRLGYSFNDGIGGSNDEINKVAYAIGWKGGDVVDFGLSELFLEMSEDGTTKYEPTMEITPNCTRSMFDGKLFHAVAKHIGTGETTKAEAEE